MLMEIRNEAQLLFYNGPSFKKYCNNGDLLLHHQYNLLVNEKYYAAKELLSIICH